MKRIIITTNNLNRSGYRILTEGIDMTAFSKNPVMFYDHSTYRLPIGKWEDIQVDENGVMSGLPVFDEDDEFAKQIKLKYEKGYINAASLQVRTLEFSDAVEHLVVGQKYETITKSEMLEISMVGIPGNAQAVRLSGDAEPPILKLVNSKKMDFKNIALSLGLAETATEAEINTAIGGMKAAQVDAVVKMGLDKGLITEASKATWVAMAQANLENVKALVDTHVATVVQAAPTTPTKSLMETLRVAATAIPAATVETDRQSWTFDDWQKKDTAGLIKMRNDDPKQYEVLAQGYYQGITGHPYSDK
jgi:Caudovirus prohead serine protease